MNPLATCSWSRKNVAGGNWFGDSVTRVTGQSVYKKVHCSDGEAIVFNFDDGLLWHRSRLIVERRREEVGVEKLRGGFEGQMIATTDYHGFYLCIVGVPRLRVPCCMSNVLDDGVFVPLVWWETATGWWDLINRENVEQGLSMSMVGVGMRGSMREER